MASSAFRAVEKAPPASNRPVTSRWAAGPIAVVLAILLGTFGLRVWDLGGPSFWWDEAYSTMIGQKSLGAIVATIPLEDFHPPFHYFVLHYWMRVAGLSEFALRFPTVAASVLAVAAAWSLGRRLFGRGVPSALIFATAPFLFYYARETRMYGYVPLLTLIALYYCDRAVTTSRRRDWLGFTLVIALGFYNFYYALFLPFACGAWVFCVARRRWRQLAEWAVATAIAFVLYIPWLSVFFHESSIWATANPPPVDNGVKILVWTWPALVLGLPTLNLWQNPPVAILLGLVLLLFLVVAVAAVVVRRSKPGLLLAVLAFAVPMLTMALIATQKAIYHPRYAMPVTAGLYLGFGGLATLLLQKKGPFRWATSILGVALLAVVVGYGMMQLQTDGTYAKDNYRGAIAYMHQHEQPGDALIDNAIPPVWYYDRNRTPSTYIPIGPYDEQHIAATLNQLAVSHRRLWYLHHLSIPNDPDGLIDSQLAHHATKLDEKWFGPLRLQLWQIDPGQPFGAVALQPANANVANQLHLTGYALVGNPVGGTTVEVDLHFDVVRTPNADDGVWVAIEDAAGHTWGRGDARPSDRALKMSSHWTVGEGVTMPVNLKLLPGIPPGRYQLAAGVYRLNTLAGLDVLGSRGQPIGQSMVVGPVTVTTPSSGAGDASLPAHPNVEVIPGIRLVGAGVSPRQLEPGQKAVVTLLWHADQQTTGGDATLRLVGASGAMIGSEASPIGGVYPASHWQVGNLVREQRDLLIPATAPNGMLQVQVVVGANAPVQIGAIDVNRIDHIFTAPPIQHLLSARFGTLAELLGYQISPPPLHPGDKLDLTLYWRANQPSSVGYHVFTHILDAKNRIWGQSDSVPVNWTRPTPGWLPNEIIVDHYSIPLKPDTPPGPYTIEVGLYDPSSGVRLPVGQTDRVVLERITVLGR